MSGSNVFFYSHKFSDSLLNSIADGIEPLECTQIQKFTRIDGRAVSHGFSLLSPDDRVSIFEILDGIQQIISKMWTSFVFEFSICSLYCSIRFFFLCWIHWQCQTIFHTSFSNCFITYFHFETHQLPIEEIKDHSAAVYLYYQR